MELILPPTVADNARQTRIGTRFVNTELFRESAAHYRKHGYYCDAPEGSKDWEDFWDQETHRITYGYEVGGTKITGDHYFYLNYCRMLRVEDAFDEITGMRKKSANKIEDFPAFWDGDYNYFWTLEIARDGISDAKYKALNLDVKINDLTGGHHMVVLKARGKGYSYKGGCLLSKRFNVGRKQKGYAFAEEKEFLIKDGLLNKAFDNISFLDDHTAWSQPKLKDQEMYKVSGYEKHTESGFVQVGTKNEIMGVTLKDNPDRARGKRGVLGLFEEAGKCPGLLKAWEVCRPSFEQGALATGIMIAYGTGGTEDADYAGLEELFYHPEAHNVIPLENIWDDGAEGNECSFFMPSYENWEGFMDKDGNSDIEGAKEYFMEHRELKKKSKDNKAIEQYICENPFTPRKQPSKRKPTCFLQRISPPIVPGSSPAAVT